MKTAVLFLIALSVLSGCSMLSPVSRPMHTYLLQDAVSEQASPVKTGTKVLLVSDIIAPTWLDTAQMAYQLQNNQISYFAENKWAAPPAEQLKPLVMHALSATGLYRAVVTEPFMGHYDQRLDIRLLEMQQLFTPASSDYVVTLQVQLLDKASQKIIASKRFHLIVSVAQNNPQSGVAAANQAVNAWLMQLVNFVYDAKKPHPNFR